MRLIVLGAGGFIGSRLAAQVAAHGHWGGRRVDELVLFDQHGPHGITHGPQGVATAGGLARPPHARCAVRHAGRRADASGPGQRQRLGPDRLAHPRAPARPANHVPAGRGHPRRGGIRRQRGTQLLAPGRFARAILAGRAHHEPARLDRHADADRSGRRPPCAASRRSVRGLASRRRAAAIVDSWPRVFTSQRVLAIRSEPRATARLFNEHGVKG